MSCYSKRFQLQCPFPDNCCKHTTVLIHLTVGSQIVQAHVKGHSLVRSIIHYCVTCRRHEGAPFKTSIYHPRCQLSGFRNSHPSSIPESTMPVRFIFDRRKLARYGYASLLAESLVQFTWNWLRTCQLTPSLDV